MSLEQTLLDDLDSDSDVEVGVGETIYHSLARIIDSGGTATVDDNVTSAIVPLIDAITEEMATYKGKDIRVMELLSEIDGDQTREERFLHLLNELSVVIGSEIAVFHQWIKERYHLVFPELENVVKVASDYAKIVKLIGNDVSGVRQQEDQLLAIVSREKVLVIMMAGSTHIKTEVSTVADIRRGCDVVLALTQLMVDIGQFIGDRVGRIAPNMTAILGPITTSQLIVAQGSLAQLAQYPSCNLPSLGVRQLSTTTESRGDNHIRQKGYLYYNPLIFNIPREYIKLAMRMVSGKVILAARVDLLKSSTNGDIGAKFRLELENKIEKLMTPPDLTPDKALPLPKEFKSKKRGGRKYRKMKERMQVSNVRRAQNVVEFGKAENTMTTGMGEEVGLGMLGSMRVHDSGATKAKLSKLMANRVSKS